jgi:hypothetical protein
MNRLFPQRAAAVSAPGFVLLACVLAVAARAQQSAADPSASAPVSASAPISIASVATEGVSVSGSLSVADGRAVIGNNGSIMAGDKTVQVQLTRGGTLHVCASTRIHLSTDNSTPGGALMIAIDRGAMEAHYTPGQYSDVVLTPDLRILISPPGDADLSLRVNNEGDTCVDNHGEHAPYVLASSLFDGGAYRIQPNQRVLFEHGSLRSVVDNEPEPCGCPSTARDKAPNQAAADNPFPLAESEGLAPPPPPPSKPVVPAGEAHAEVEAPLVYNAAAPPPPPSRTTASESAGTPEPAPPAKKAHHGFFAPIGHFFKHLFGAK